MIRQHFRVALLAGGILAAAALSARAEDDASKPASGAKAPVGSTQYCTVCCREWVPEQYQCTRTVYRRECRQENYTAYRCECYPVQRTYTVCEYKSVPEYRTVCKKICTCVPCYEERTVMQTCYRCEAYTKCVRRCVNRGHWECRQVPCYNHGFGGWFRGRRHHCCHDSCNSCGDSCGDNCCNSCCCVPMKTIRCWVSCPTWEECPVTCYRRVCECKPVCVKVCSYKHVVKEVQCQVCCYKCVPCQRQVTCCTMCRRMVPYQACRTVACCVPQCETYTACRMVCRCVMKQVACCNPCDNCGNDCCNSGCNTCCDYGCHRSRWHRWFGRHHCCGHNDCCGSSCSSGCGTGCCN